MSFSCTFLRARAMRCIGALVLAICGIGATYGSLADAAEPAAPRSKVLVHRDLDLSTPAGIEALYQRIHEAAREVCRPADRILNLYAPRARVECYWRTVAHAVARVDRPALTARHRLAQRVQPLAQRGDR